MASAPTVPAPPSSGAPSGAMPPMAGTYPPEASTAPAEVSPELESGSRDLIAIVQSLKRIQSAFPTTSEEINQINDLLEQVQVKMMQGAKVGTAAAPPVNG
jgi:hypothetical protein